MNTPLHPPATTLEAIRHHTTVVGPSSKPATDGEPPHPKTTTPSTT